MVFQRLIAPTLPELFERAAQRFGDLPAFAHRVEGKRWDPISFRELFDQGRALATGLIELGVRHGEHVGLLADNRREWILSDYGIQLCGAVNVPRGSDVTDEEIVYIFSHAGVRVAFVENDALIDRIVRLRSRLPHLEHLIRMAEASGHREGVWNLHDLLERGRVARSRGNRDAEAAAGKTQPGDLFTLIYTSGTTGEPKGVMLTHANMISQLRHIPLEITCTDRVLSILPVWHIFERVFEMLAISCGCCTYYTSIRHLGQDLREVEPTFMGSAPRLWESLHHRILQGIRQAHPVRRALFHTARFLSEHYHWALGGIRQQHLQLRRRSCFEQVVSRLGCALLWLLLLPWYGFFNTAVLERIRWVAGGSLKGTVSGGGALPREVDLFFNQIGIRVLEGYGLTESSPVISVRIPEKMVIGTVGPPIGETRVRIVSPENGEVLYPNAKNPDRGKGMIGEICIQGPQVMRGYYRREKETARVLRDGWLHTGDLGCFTFNNCLRVVGRHKETIVLTNGENVEPGPIEMRLRQSPLIDQCMVTGQDKGFLSALIVPRGEGFRELGLTAESLPSMAGDPEVRRLLETEISTLISRSNGFKARERIRTFHLLERPFEVGREVTNLHKLRRHVIEQTFREEIDALYALKKEKGGRA